MPTSTCLDDLFSRHYRQLLAWCRRNTPHDLGDPEDFVHTAYLRCRGHWTAERSSQKCETAYLYRAIRWVIGDALRRSSRRRKGLPLIARRELEPSGGRLRELVADEALAHLPQRQREVCQGFLAGKDEDQLGRELQVSRGTLAVHLCRAKVRLCQALEVPAHRRGRE